MRKVLFEWETVSGLTLEDKLRMLSRDYGIEVLERNPLKLTLKGSLLDLVAPEIFPIYLIDNEILIFNDMKPRSNIHAYKLDGTKLWDIEGCKDRYGEPVEYFMSVGGPEDIKGERVLTLISFPMTFATNLLTGKGTRIIQIDDDENYR